MQWRSCWECATCLDAISMVFKLVLLNAKAHDLQIFGTEHDAEGSGSGELSLDEECSGFTVDCAIAAYYEFHSNPQT